jgi:hypothetical protein
MLERIVNRLRDFVNTRTGFIVTVVALALAAALALQALLNRSEGSR